MYNSVATLHETGRWDHPLAESEVYLVGWWGSVVHFYSGSLRHVEAGWERFRFCLNPNKTKWLWVLGPPESGDFPPLTLVRVADRDGTQFAGPLGLAALDWEDGHEGVLLKSFLCTTCGPSCPERLCSWSLMFCSSSSWTGAMCSAWISTFSSVPQYMRFGT